MILRFAFLRGLVEALFYTPEYIDDDDDDGWEHS